MGLKTLPPSRVDFLENLEATTVWYPKGLFRLAGEYGLLLPLLTRRQMNEAHTTKYYAFKKHFNIILYM